MGRLRQEFVPLLHPYYLVNLVACLSYVLAKRVPAACGLLFRPDHCELDGRETEILFFLVSVVAIRTRRAGSVSAADYLSASFAYARLANLALWWYADARLGLAYGALVALVALACPKPAQECAERIVYFRGGADLDDELKRRGDVTWAIAFYAAWHPACTTFAPVFARLSAAYSLDNLKFGKVDVGRFPEVAKKYGILDSALSKQLPTVILFKDGKEAIRRPQADSKNRLIKFLFSEDNMKATFDFVGLHKECKEALESRKAIAGSGKKKAE